MEYEVCEKTILIKPQIYRLSLSVSRHDTFPPEPLTRRHRADAESGSYTGEQAEESIRQRPAM